MASIWFGDLGDQSIELNDEIKGEKAKDILDSLYNDWTEKHPDIFNDFKPVIISDNGEMKLGDFVGFDDDEYSLTFISQGTSNHDISWGWQKYEMGANEVIRIFTNDLLKRLGYDSKLIFSFEVNADDGYEEVSIEITPDFENKFPNVESSTDFNSTNEDEEDGQDLDNNNNAKDDEEIGAISKDIANEALDKFPNDMRAAANSISVSYEEFKKFVFKDVSWPSLKDKWAPELKESSDIVNPDIVEKIRKICEDCLEKGESLPGWPDILSENGFDVEKYSIMTAIVKVQLEGGNFLIGKMYRVKDKADFIIGDIAGWYEE